MSARRVGRFVAKCRSARLSAGSSRVALGGFLFVAALALALILVWTSSAPALTLPALGTQVKSTFAAGGKHSLAIKADGTLWAWGRDEVGQVGSGVYGDQPNPTRIGTTSDWVAVAAGSQHSLALKADGSLWAWGDPHQGGHLIGDWPGYGSAPSRVGTGTDWVAIAAGGTHSLGVRSDGSLWAWGYNDDGQLGDGTTVDRQVPTRIGAGNDWVAVAAGSYHSLALTADGSLWAWGSNHWGELGDGTTVDRQVPTRIGAGNDWVAVDAGRDHSVALRSDGSLWAWGRNDHGQLGDGATTDRHAPVFVGTGTGWTAVSAGDGFTLALTSDGSLWAWGDNEYGKLGTGDNTERHAPTRVGAGTGWVAVSAGNYHALGLGGAGTLLAWGANFGGALGNGTTTDRSSPGLSLAGVKLPSAATTTSSTTTSSSTTTTLASGATFSDISSSSYKEAIEDLAAEGIIGGYDDGTFRPLNPVLRAQFAKMIVLSLEFTVTEGGVPLHFWDVEKPTNNLYPDDYVAVAAANELILGYPDGSFKPYNDVTRAQVLTIVVRAAMSFRPYYLKTLPPGWKGVLPATDPTHGSNIAVAEYSGFLNGINLSTFDVNGKATRGEVAQILWNLWRS